MKNSGYVDHVDLGKSSSLIETSSCLLNVKMTQTAAYSTVDVRGQNHTTTLRIA